MINRRDQNRILKKIKEMANDPLKTANVKKLVDFNDSYRLRVGDFRVLFRRDDAEVTIIVIRIIKRKL
jgi:mRNA interferase RelE/StbE